MSRILGATTTIAVASHDDVALSSVAAAMNPLLSSLSLLGARDLGGKDGGTVSRLARSEQRVLQGLAIAASTVSIVSSVVALYWFLKMRRSFRHDLIMLLIQSDMFKTIWYLVYPIVTQVHGAVDSKSQYCQISGFFTAFGIEAGDVAILLIAIHTALYVFGPHSNAWDGGLYPYRRYAFAAWLGLPLVAASLAFVNKDGYAAIGTICYLPVRPYWYRIWLSWVPRYAIFASILGLYATVYFYVNKKLHGFRKEGNEKGQTCAHCPASVVPCSHSRSPDEVPPLPPLQLHGLLPDSKPASVAEAKKQGTIAIIMASLPTPTSPSSRIRAWRHAPKPLSTVVSAEVASEDTDSFSGPSTPKPYPSIVAFDENVNHDPSGSSTLTSVLPSVSRKTSWRDAFVSRLATPRSTISHSSHAIASFLRAHSPKSGPSTPIPRLRLVDSRGQDLQDLDLIATRNKFRRQLWYVFMYPLVYMAMWTLPFVYSLLLYHDRFARHPPFALRCAVTFISPLQAAIDCWLFATREQPWKHIPGHDGSFIGSLLFWRDWSELRRRYALRSGPGRTKEEMHREAAAAYARRKEETWLEQQRRSVVVVAGAGAGDDGGAETVGGRPRGAAIGSGRVLRLQTSGLDLDGLMSPKDADFAGWRV